MNFSSLSAPLLKEERMRLGLSQAEAAEKCGVSREIWGRYERGAAVPGGEVLKALAELGADVQYILTGSNRPSMSDLPTANSNTTSMSHFPSDENLQIDADRLARIVEMLEAVAKQAGRRWPVKKLISVAAEVYNALGQERVLDEPKVERILKLVVNR